MEREGEAELSALKDRLDKAQTIDIDPANPPYQITIRGTSGIKRVKIVEVEG